MVKLRELVAVEVMGAKVITTIDPVPDGIYVRNGAVYYGNDADRLRCERFVPDKNIADAWRVVEKMKTQCFRCSIEDFGNRYRVNFSYQEAWKHQNSEEGLDVPQLICLAALRACGVSEDRIEQARKEQR